MRLQCVIYICVKCAGLTACEVGCAEQDKERVQRHHDELVISINTGKNDLREKKKERGAVADANRKVGYAAMPVLHCSSCISCPGIVLRLGNLCICCSCMLSEKCKMCMLFSSAFVVAAC